MDEEIKKFKSSGSLGKTKYTATSDLFGGETLDTKIDIGESHLCTVAGDEFPEFIEALRSLISQYSI